MSYKNLRDFELHRSPYDKIMLKMYNPDYKFTNFDYPMPRTNFDLNLEKKWCPHCLGQYEYFNLNNFKEKSFKENFVLTFNRLS